MKGNMKVYYTIQCESDINVEISLEAILSNEKVLKSIKQEFAKKSVNVEVVQVSKEMGVVAKARSVKTVYDFEMPKDDFADALTFAEEDAKKNKRLKKGCQGVELVDIQTL